MTLKIELSDASFEAVRYAYYSSNGKRWNMKVAFNNAITAALEAMVAEGTAQEGLGWEFKNGKFGAYGREVIKEGDLVFPALIIRLGGKP